MLKSLFRQPLFVIGFVFVVGLTLASIGNYFISHDQVAAHKLIYNKQGNLVAQAPLSPAEKPPLGTDVRGHNMALLLLAGAKYTILGAIAIGLIRMALSAIFGYIYGTYLYRFRRFITGILDGFHYIPMTLLAYLILASVLFMDSMVGQFAYSFLARVIFEVIVLAVIAVPVVSIQIGNVIGEIKQRDYIESAKILGSSKWQMFWRHIRPHLTPRFFLIFVQQVIQVLIIMAHLGVLHLFFGGTIALSDRFSHEFYSLSNEWSGLVGAYRNNYLSFPWMFFAPILMFTLTILALSFMLEGIKKAITMNQTSKKLKDRQSARENTSDTILAEKAGRVETAFDFIHRAG